MVYHLHQVQCHQYPHLTLTEDPLQLYPIQMITTDLHQTDTRDQRELSQHHLLLVNKNLRKYFKEIKQYQVVLYLELSRTQVQVNLLVP